MSDVLVAASRARIVACTLSLMLALAACTSMNGLEPRASLQEPDKLAAGESLANFPTGDGLWPRTDWWRSFNDPQLDALIVESIAGSPSVKVAEARVRKAMALADAADAVSAPLVSGRLTMTEQRFSEHDVYPPPFAGTWNSQNRAALNFNYEFDFWGKNRALFEGALGQAKAAEADAFAARLMLSLAVSHAYVQLQRSFLQLDIAELAVTQREQIFALTKQRYDAGLDAKTSVQQAESALAETRQQLAAIKEVMALSRNRLAALSGHGPDRMLRLARPKLEPVGAVVPMQLHAGLIGRRPDIVAQRWRVEAAAKDIVVAKAQFYPDVNLMAFLGLQSIGLAHFVQTGSAVAGIGPAIDLPLFDGGRLRANLAVRDSDYDIAVEQYNQTLVEALQEVVDQLTSLRSLEEQGAQQQVALARSQEAYQLATLRYRKGLGSYLEVLSFGARVLAQQAQTADLDMRKLDTSIGLIKALGGGYEATAIIFSRANPDSLP